MDETREDTIKAIQLKRNEIVKILQGMDLSDECLALVPDDELTMLVVGLQNVENELEF